MVGGSTFWCRNYMMTIANNSNANWKFYRNTILYLNKLGDKIILLHITNSEKERQLALKKWVFFGINLWDEEGKEREKKCEIKSTNLPHLYIRCSSHSKWENTAVHVWRIVCARLSYPTTVYIIFLAYCWNFFQAHAPTAPFFPTLRHSEQICHFAASFFSLLKRSCINAIFALYNRKGGIYTCK